MFTWKKGANAGKRLDETPLVDLQRSLAGASSAGFVVMLQAEVARRIAGSAVRATETTDREARRLAVETGAAPKPGRCEGCGRSSDPKYPLHWSNAFGGWTCLGCHARAEVKSR